MATRKPKKQKVDTNAQPDSSKITAKLESDRVLPTGLDVSIRKKTYRLAGGNLDVENTAIIEEAEESIKSLKESLDSNLKELESKTDSNTIKFVNEKITDLSVLATNLTELLRSRMEIEPELSIIQPQIKLVDANVAYKYADLQSDANNLTNFATLFLGTGIAALVSLIVSLLTEKNNISIAIHSTTVLLSLIVTTIFGVLARNSNKRAKQAREILDATATVAET